MDVSTLTSKDIERAQLSKKRRRRRIATLVFVFIYLIGLGLLLYPTISDRMNAAKNDRMISRYDYAVSRAGDARYQEIYAGAEEYNAQHSYNNFSDIFARETFFHTHMYDTLLDPSGNGVMGYLSIPKVGQRLAIYHGTSDAVLSTGLGHVMGSSLPIGGENTHTVLAGHRGLPSAKILSDLDQMVIGDRFFLYIMNESLAYEVDQIKVVDPNDASFLDIIPGEDHVTLYTCTPYGVNTHRMLVRGKRIEFEEAAVEEESGKRELNERDRPALIISAILAVLLVIYLIVLIVLSARRRLRER